MEVPSSQPALANQGEVRGIERVASLRKERVLDRERVGALLGAWRSRELLSARGWRQCRGVSTEQLEDIYQDTSLVLLDRAYNDEEHLSYGLRAGIRMRALGIRREEISHEQILISNADELGLLAQARAMLDRPERAFLALQDRLLACEFMTALTDTETYVFCLLAEGMGHNRIARLMGVDPNEARRVVRSCERKCKQFETLYRAGRLCGYREATILALQRGQATSERLAQGAFAHLESCAQCRAKHKTNVKQLRNSFRSHAVAAILPIPALLTHLPWLRRAGVRARLIQHRLLGDGLTFWPTGLREQSTALLAGCGVSVKAATGAVTAAVIAGGAISATHALDTRHTDQQQQRDKGTEAIRRDAEPAAVFPQSVSRLSMTSPGTFSAPVLLTFSGPGHVVGEIHHRSRRDPDALRARGSFKAINVPVTRTRTTESVPPAPETSHGGGPFDP